MISYRFTYTDASGAVIRWTSMQCISDAEAVRRARESMQDKYAGLEIFEGERKVDLEAPVGA
jgi:hypothetical protein